MPVSETFGGWRTGLGVWAVLAVLAALPWLALVAHDRRPADSGRRRDAAARSLAPGSAGQWPSPSGSSHCRRMSSSAGSPSSGATPATPPSPPGRSSASSRGPASRSPSGCLLPPPAARARSACSCRVSACYLVGYAGLLVAPYALAIPCAILIGVGTCTFALVLTLIGLRSRTPDGTAALSGFSQSSGYLLAALGPFAVGALHDATGSWTAPLLLLLALALPLMSLAVRVARPAAIEDELPSRPGAGVD